MDWTAIGTLISAGVGLVLASLFVGTKLIRGDLIKELDKRYVPANICAMKDSNVNLLLTNTNERLDRMSEKLTVMAEALSDVQNRLTRLEALLNSQ